jgi:hypothetical protein
VEAAGGVDHENGWISLERADQRERLVEGEIEAHYRACNSFREKCCLSSLTSAAVQGLRIILLFFALATFFSSGVYISCADRPSSESSKQLAASWVQQTIPEIGVSPCSNSARSE